MTSVCNSKMTVFVVADNLLDHPNVCSIITDYVTLEYINRVHSLDALTAFNFASQNTSFGAHFKWTKTFYQCKSPLLAKDKSPKDLYELEFENEIFLISRWFFEIASSASYHNDNHIARPASAFRFFSISLALYLSLPSPGPFNSLTFLISHVRLSASIFVAIDRHAVSSREKKIFRKMCILSVEPSRWLVMFG